jgi:pimeloyl-ACP methyl ester carboxylesterase
VTVFVVAHGAWSAAWAWKKMRPLLRAAGHELWTPTYTGLGERVHLANPTVKLDTHIADVVGMLEMEDLRDVVLIAHSYGGMVATGVADRARERIAQLVYLDAFVPQDGQSLFDLQSPETRAHARTRAHRRRWLAPAADPDAGGHTRCRRGLGVGPQAAAADQDVRAALASCRQRRAASPPLHLLPTLRTGRCVSPVRRPRPA